ncbi:uncharacterized protein ACA1_374170 [Acanthamoeba castellanii str. Neff]|uniref:Uncharacterized protein n=1 Tax=Acanthamoeba castellanii (strain ATCC 30010 / Neff) TaxID=1257118 RepID=L8GGX8_ACACF|nr:uncharacterized protein ACA1_374170 [Acanthamoeba castellanii str. Neff]ELR12350.1 hypothetical protein ACA1_374170 [Acanthamoeba castellanii str. Neff]
MKNVSKIVIVPGNHVADVKKSIWYYWCQQHLLKGLNVRRLGIPVILEDMPDPDAAHRDVWLPFIKQELRCDENTILIGHSSGAEAAMSPEEKESGYYTGEWQWERIKANADWIVQFGSTDDPYLPQKEMDYVHEKLGTEYHMYSDKGHFLLGEFPELVDVVLQKTDMLHHGPQDQTHGLPK